MPDVDIASDRRVVTPVGAYYRTGEYAPANLSIDYALTPAIDVSGGGRKSVRRELCDGGRIPRTGPEPVPQPARY